MSTISQIEASLADTLRGKVVVVDTSSLLVAGTALLNHVENCTVVVPAVVVRELEDKRGHATLGFLSREWIRLLEELRVANGRRLAEGVPSLKNETVKLMVEPNHSTQKFLPKHLQDGSNDSTVLSVACNLGSESENTGRVVILSNDAPMRLHATLDLNIPAFEYASAEKRPFSGVYTVAVSQETYADEEAAFSGRTGLRAATVEEILSKLPTDRASNARLSVVLEGAGVTVGEFILSGDEIRSLERKQKVYSVTPRSVEQDMAVAMLREPAATLPVVSLGGGAGTGKTLMTVAVALDALKSGEYQKVVVFRSLHEMGQGQEMGFLPGDVDGKMEAWAGAVFDALDVLAAERKPLKKNAGPEAHTRQKEAAQKLRDMIEVSPITYLRGRSLANTFMVLEEAQNFSRHEILNILSRAGQGTKVVLTFDAAQVDNRFLRSGGKADVWAVIDELKSSDVFAHVTLTSTERSRVAEIASGLLEG